MSKPQFVYVIYIKAAPERIWDAITKPEMTAKYWMKENLSDDWKTGSRWRHVDAGGDRRCIWSARSSKATTRSVSR